MAKYEINYGLKAPYLQARNSETIEVPCEAEAERIARDLAIDEYCFYEGDGVLPSYDDIIDELCLDWGIDTDDFSTNNWLYVDELYNREINSWIEYFVKEIRE